MFPDEYPQAFRMRLVAGCVSGFYDNVMRIRDTHEHITFLCCDSGTIA